VWKKQNDTRGDKRHIDYRGETRPQSTEIQMLPSFQPHLVFGGGAGVKAHTGGEGK